MLGGWTMFQRKKQRDHLHRHLLSQDEVPVEAVFDQPIEEIASSVSSPVNERGG